MKFTLIKTKDSYIAENCNCNTLFRKAVITFSDSCDVSLAYIYADSTSIGVCALSSIKGKIMEAECECDSISHFDKIEIKVDGKAVLHSIEFSSEPIYSDVSYTQTPENALVDIQSDTWEATDMLGRKVARDDENLYFSVFCANKITEPDNNWMTLFIDCDRDKSTGWEGYDFAVNRLIPENNSVIIERYTDGFEKIGFGEYTLKDNHLQIKIPRKALGLTDNLNFEFKWSDNMQKQDVMDFYLNGDCAPLGRFNYLYKE